MCYRATSTAVAARSCVDGKTKTILESFKIGYFKIKQNKELSAQLTRMAADWECHLTLPRQVLALDMACVAAHMSSVSAE